VANLEALAAQEATEADRVPVTQPEWPTLAPDARHGLVGRFVSAIEPHTEADPVAVQLQFLLFFGNVIGRRAYFAVEADCHYLNLFAVLVGESSKGRKGVSLGQSRRLYQAIDPDWADQRIESGLSSGEGLIWAVRDPIEKRERVNKKGAPPRYVTVIADPGVDDKRLVVCESEFASTLRVLARDGNTLSAVIRTAWDSGSLSTLTKNSPARATGAHIAIIGHVTRPELLRYLTSTEAGNGFGNRFLWCCVRRSKFLPEGGQAHSLDLGPLMRELGEAVRFARGVETISRDDEAREIWASVYPDLSAGRPGLLGSMTARAEAQTMRLASIYALLDRSHSVRREHLMAALALWDYCEASARYIFGHALGDPVADEILRAMKAAPHGMTRTEVRDLFGRNKKADEVGRALGLLLEQNLVVFRKEPTGGRPTERWFAKDLAPDEEVCEA
jgi:hypothetical protein